MNKLEAKREIAMESGFAPLGNGSRQATKRVIEELKRGGLSKCQLRSIRRIQREQEAIFSSGSIEFNRQSI